MVQDSTKQERSEAAAMLGRKSAKVRMKKYGKKHMKKLARLGGKARWAKKKSPRSEG